MPPSTIPDFHRLYLFGAGGAGQETAWMAKETWGSVVELRFVVDAPEFAQTSINGIPVILANDIRATANDRYLLAVGDIALRRHAEFVMSRLGMNATRLVHPSAVISPYVELGEGTIVAAGSVLTTHLTLARHVLINVGCTISHNVSISDFSTLSPGVHVCGHVQIGTDVFVGAGATIINGQPNEPLVIGSGAVIAAGACVTTNVEPKALVAGVPAVRKR